MRPGRAGLSGGQAHGYSQPPAAAILCAGYGRSVTPLCESREISMSNPVIVVHYHELWLKGGNRRFFLGKLFTALRQSFQGIPVQRIEQPGDRFLVRLGEGADLEAAVARVERVLGVAYYAVARPVE